MVIAIWEFVPRYIPAKDWFVLKPSEWFTIFCLERVICVYIYIYMYTCIWMDGIVMGDICDEPYPFGMYYVVCGVGFNKCSKCEKL